MTIGPAPMMRIDLMSVLLGIGSRKLDTKKGRAYARSPDRAEGSSLARGAHIDPNRRAGKGAGGISGGRTKPAKTRQNYISVLALDPRPLLSSRQRQTRS